MLHVVKRKGRTEPFDPRKVYASAYAACRNAHLSERESEQIAEAVQKGIERWIKKKDQVTSEEIFSEVTRLLGELHPDAAFLYQTHRDLA